MIYIQISFNRYKSLQNSHIYDITEQAIIKHYSNFSSGYNFNDKAVVKIFKADNGDILVGNMTGFYYFDKDAERFNIVEGFVNPFVHWIYQSSDGVIWVATIRDGLYRLKKDGTKYIAEHVPTEYMDLTTVFEDSRGNFWIGTHTHGLLLYDRKKGKSIPMNLNVCQTNNVIGKIVEDKSSCLWISTSNGLYSYNLLTGEEFRYGVHNSLPTDQFNVSSGIFAPDGKMYFGTMKGLIVFNPYKLNQQKKTYKVYFTDFISSESSFSVNFAVPIFSSLQSLWYRYKLEGIDDNWTIVQGAQNIKYNNLKPGAYQLVAQASTINGLWSNDVNDYSTLSIEIEYPLLLSPIAFVLYILVIVLAATFMMCSYRRRIASERQQQLYKLRNEMDKELLSDKIKFFTDITHEIRTPLTLIIGGLERIKKVCNDKSVSIMQQNVDRLQNLVNQLLDFRKIEVSSYMVDMQVINITPILSNG